MAWRPAPGARAVPRGAASCAARARMDRPPEAPPPAPEACRAPCRRIRTAPRPSSSDNGPGSRTRARGPRRRPAACRLGADVAARCPSTTRPRWRRAGRPAPRSHTGRPRAARSTRSTPASASRALAIAPRDAMVSQLEVGVLNNKRVEAQVGVGQLQRRHFLLRRRPRPLVRRHGVAPQPELHEDVRGHVQRVLGLGRDLRVAPRRLQAARRELGLSQA